MWRRTAIHKEPKRGIYSSYSLDAQLIAVACLGNCGNTEALAFIRKLYTPKINVVEIYESASQGGDTWYDIGEDEIHSYPNAHGALANALYFSVNVTTVGSWGGKGSHRNEQDIEKDRQEKINKSNAHTTVREALSKLGALVIDERI